MDLGPGPGLPVVDLWDRTNPRSIINIVPETIAAAMIRSSQDRPDLFAMDERALMKEVSPSPTDNRIRLAFWMAYDLAQNSQRHIVMTSVYSGVCTRSFFDRSWTQSPEHIAWMLCMPDSYEAVLDEAIVYGLKKMRDILDLPEMDKQGRLNVAIVALKAKVFSMLEMRKHGAYTVTNKNMNLNVSTDDRSVAKQIMEGNMGEIEQRLKFLEAKERKALNLPEKKEVEVVAEQETPDGR